MISDQLISQHTVAKTYVRILPLYNTLIANLTQRVNQGSISVTSEYKSKLMATLNSLDPTRAREVSLLLIHYYFLLNPEYNPFINLNRINKPSSRSINVNLPYDIRPSPSGTGLSFDIDKLPSSFQALLGIYCSL